jgi:hypothetical protein
MEKGDPKEAPTVGPNWEEKSSQKKFSQNRLTIFLF